MKQLKDNKSIIIKPIDKNMGPAIKDTKNYIQQVLEEYLLSKNYMQLPKEEAKLKMDNSKNMLKNMISHNHVNHTKSESTYFQYSLQSIHRLPVFYWLPKDHIISSCGSLLFLLQLVGLQNEGTTTLHEIIRKKLFLSYKNLKKLQIHSNDLFFSVDAKLVYTNFNTNMGILSVRCFI